MSLTYQLHRSLPMSSRKLILTWLSIVVGAVASFAVGAAVAQAFLNGGR